MEGLPVSYSLNSGDNGNNWWGDFIGAAIGGAAGAAWGRGNNNGCCGNDGGGCCNNNDQFIMDTLTTMRTDVNGIGRDQLIQTQQIGQGICQGFGGIATEIANLGSQLSQGQCRTEAAVLTTGLNGQIQQKDNTIAQLEAFQFNTALAAGDAQQTRNEMQGQTALILAALRDRTSSFSGGAAA